MTQPALRALWTLAASALLACGGAPDPGASPGPSEPGPVGAGSGLELRVDGFVLRPAIRDVNPAAGRRFLLADVTISNRQRVTPVPVASTLFSTETDRALLLSASPAGALLPGPCAADLALSTGGSLSCQVAFELPLDQQPRRMRYAGLDSAGAQVMVATDYPAQPRCEQPTFTRGIYRLIPGGRHATTCDGLLAQVWPTRYEAEMGEKGQSLIFYGSEGVFGRIEDQERAVPLQCGAGTDRGGLLTGVEGCLAELQGERSYEIDGSNRFTERVRGTLRIRTPEGGPCSELPSSCAVDTRFSYQR